MRRLLLLGIALIAVFGLVAGGCAPAQTPQPTSGGTTPAPAATTPATAPSQPTEEKFEWAVQGAYANTVHRYYEMVEMWDRVSMITEGRLTAKVYQQGEIASVFGEPWYFLQDGTVDATWASVTPMLGIHGDQLRLWAPSGFPAGPVAEELFAWWYEGDGLTIMRKELDQWGYVIGAEPTTAECFAHSNKPITTAKDMKGLKFRTGGLWGELLAGNFGASVVYLAGGEIYEAMQRGVIDAFEYCGPAINWPMGYQEIAKYLIMPGIHSPVSNDEFIANHDSWNKLPDTYKQLLEDEFMLFGLKSLQRERVEDAIAMQKYADYGTTILYLTPEFQEQIVAVSKAWVDKRVATDPVFKSVFENMDTFIRQYHKSAAPAFSMFQ